MLIADSCLQAHPQRPITDIDTGQDGSWRSGTPAAQGEFIPRAALVTGHGTTVKREVRGGRRCATGSGHPHGSTAALHGRLSRAYADHHRAQATESVSETLTASFSQYPQTPARNAARSQCRFIADFGDAAHLSVGRSLSIPYRAFSQTANRLPSVISILSAVNLPLKMRAIAPRATPTASGRRQSGQICAEP